MLAQTYERAHQDSMAIKKEAQLKKEHTNDEARVQHGPPT